MHFWPLCQKSHGCKNVGLYVGPQFHPIDQEIQDLHCGPIRCEQTEEVRNIPQKRQRELSKRGLKRDWKMWCPEGQEKKMARKGMAHCVQWCEEFVLIRFQNCHSSSLTGSDVSQERNYSQWEKHIILRALLQRKQGHDGILKEMTKNEIQGPSDGVSSAQGVHLRW